jgi:hypothetical protein
VMMCHDAMMCLWLVLFPAVKSTPEKVAPELVSACQPALVSNSVF